MGICTAQVTSRSNSDLLNIEHIMSQTSRPTPDRMAQILRIALAWRDAIDGSVPHASMVADGRIPEEV